MASSSSALAISDWPFCPACHSTLTVDRSGAISCHVCSYSSHLSNIPKEQLPTTTTFSAPRPTPMWARTTSSEQAQQQQHQPVRATIEEPCIKCGHAEVGYYTVQLRSVDEGQTVFYECPNCKHTWSVNN